MRLFAYPDPWDDLDKLFWRRSSSCKCFTNACASTLLSIYLFTSTDAFAAPGIAAGCDGLDFSLISTLPNFWL